MSTREQIHRPHLWYRDAVIYEVHVRAFVDSNGDGIGDLAGIVDRLPYVASLGVDAIWISPFFPSSWPGLTVDDVRYRAA